MMTMKKVKMVQVIITMGLHKKMLMVKMERRRSKGMMNMVQVILMRVKVMKVKMIRVSMLMMFKIYYCKEQKISVQMMSNGP